MSYDRSGPGPPGLPPGPPQGLVSPRWLLSGNVQPLPPPALPKDLAELPPAVRVHACLAWYARWTEHTLSPGGHLRALVHVLCRIVIVAGILSLAATAVLACISHFPPQ